MFKKNENYRQLGLFDPTSTLSRKKSKLLGDSIEHGFFVNIFSRIDENKFKVLYSSKKSRPNVPVDQLVGSLILKHLFDWTYEELFKNLNFNILTRYAIGIRSFGEEVFSEASIYNFQNKAIDHFAQTGEDLLSGVFDSLTSSQLEGFGIKTDIQRGDSFLIGSNIFDYTRLQLPIEVLLRLYRALDEKDRRAYSTMFGGYTKQSPGQYIYRPGKKDLPKEIERIGALYHKAYTALKHKYGDLAVFKIFERAYDEHFVAVEGKPTVIPATKLGSSILMSPDDEGATYREKGVLGKKGYCGHVSETANPENRLNLITDVAVVPNNVDDAKILEGRFPEMISKTPDLEEYHTDGSYGSPTVDKIMGLYGIAQVVSAVRGRKAHAKMDIAEEGGGYWVTCENGQKVEAQGPNGKRNAKRHKAVFDYEKCLQCPLNEKCRSDISGVKTGRPKRTWYFDKEKVMLHKRQQNICLVPEERRKLRANVEATVKEVKRGIKNGKARTRGKIRITFYLVLTSIGVNLTRIHKHVLGHRPENASCIGMFALSLKKWIKMADLNGYCFGDQKNIAPVKIAA